ncbi:MAG TPA: L-rhamnose mutarotase [Sunxiuqinia sp.]|nr:L-rhamnose mutarotase [Sunxiuqinia sp.]
MNKKNVLIFFSGILMVGLLASCNQTHKKASVKQEKTIGKYRVAIELILTDSTQEEALLNGLNGIALDRYKWKNHIVLFGDASDTTGISQFIRQTGISLKMKHYDTPMYAFDRAERCGDSTVVKPWKDYLLTANLVADTTMQREYMHYHETQFAEWPEVAQGFCNADFQQLLVFKNGRQLLLVISIPPDKTLDELNPKTEENNPRVVEWNKIMAKYQEGIEGTKPGETWVFLDKVEGASGDE